MGATPQKWKTQKAEVQGTPRPQWSTGTVPFWEGREAEGVTPLGWDLFPTSVINWCPLKQSTDMTEERKKDAFLLNLRKLCFDSFQADFFLKSSFKFFKIKFRKGKFEATLFKTKRIQSSSLTSYTHAAGLYLPLQHRCKHLNSQYL